MLLKGIDIVERRKLTRGYPCMVVGYPRSGKSSAVEFLPAEEKKRTVLFVVENKRLPEDEETDYYMVVYLKPPGAEPEDDILYKDSSNTKYREIEDLLRSIKNAIALEDVDRIVIDSFTALADAYQREFMLIHNGFTVWGTYNKALTDFFQTIKDETNARGKFLYVIGHYKPSRDSKSKDAECYSVVKGNDWFRLVESQFNTVVKCEDFQLIADNTDSTDSSRIKRSLSPYESKENSLAELEIALTGTKK